MESNSPTNKSKVALFLLFQLVVASFGFRSVYGIPDHTQSCATASGQQRHTLQVLAVAVDLDYSPANCEQLYSRLLKLKELNLQNKGLVDLSPLAPMVDLRKLILDNNQISDLSPLRDLVNLRKLFLVSNNIADISPLSAMKNLTYLYLNDNRISDIKPLRKLPSLRYLFIAYNDIQDLSPLRSSYRLTWLLANNNKINDVTPLSRLKYLKLLDLTHNPLKDVSAIAHFPNFNQFRLPRNIDLTALQSRLIKKKRTPGKPQSNVTSGEQRTAERYSVGASQDLRHQSNFPAQANIPPSTMAGQPAGRQSYAEDYQSGHDQRRLDSSSTQPSAVRQFIEDLKEDQRRELGIEEEVSVTVDETDSDTVKDQVETGGKTGSLDSGTLRFHPRRDTRQTGRTIISFVDANDKSQSHQRSESGYSTQHEQTTRQNLTLSQQIPARKTRPDPPGITQEKSTPLSTVKPDEPEPPHDQSVSPIKTVGSIGNQPTDSSANDRQHVVETDPLQDQGDSQIKVSEIGGDQRTGSRTNKRQHRVEIGPLAEQNIPAAEKTEPVTDQPVDSGTKDGQHGTDTSFRRDRKASPIKQIELVDDPIADSSIKKRQQETANTTDSAPGHPQVVSIGKDPVQYQQERINEKHLRPTKSIGSTRQDSQAEDFLQDSLITTDTRGVEGELHDPVENGQTAKLYAMRTPEEEPKPEKPTTFYYKKPYPGLCKSPSKEQKHTLEILAAKVGTFYSPDNCTELYKRLQKLIMLIIEGKRLEDISPLEPLKGINWLFLYNNQINDISPLRNLNRLRSLGLDNNQIEDITPLSELDELTTLSLHNNRITDIAPLQHLKKLTSLSLHNNQIANIKPLSSLTNLTSLKLNYNSVENIAPLKTLTKLSELHLKENKIIAVEPLKHLINLKKLDLRYNNIDDFSAISHMTGFDQFLIHERKNR